MKAEELRDKTRFIDDNNSLKQLCLQLSDCDLLAVDTEFIRTQTFYPEAGLFQLSDGHEIWLIDPLAIDQWDEFRSLMLNKKVLKVLHSCSEDLLVFIAMFDLMPRPVFDTQISTTLLNLGTSLSYQNLVRHYTDIDLPKGETRSDWLQRPLTESQLDYAALDVLYLPDIACRQKNELEQAGKLSWADEEFTRLYDSYESEFTKDYSDYYQNIKGAWQLQGKNLLALSLLSTWREKRSRERDRPRNWIIRDNAILDIARQLPDTLEALGAIKDVSANFLKYEGPQVISIVNQANIADKSIWPPDLPGPLGAEMKRNLKLARACVDEVADINNLPPEYLGRRKTMVRYIQSLKDGNLPEEFEGWRGDLMMPRLNELFSTKSVGAITP